MDIIYRDQVKRYKYQQTEAGKEIVQMLEYMKKEYCEKLNIPTNEIKTGKLSALVNAKTNEIDTFIES